MNNITRAAMLMDGAASGNGAFSRVNGAERRAGGAGAPFAPCPPVSPGRHGANGAHDSRPNGARNGASNGAANGALNGARRDAEYVIYRLEEAGQTLLALPNTGYSTRLRTSSIDIVRSALEGYGWENFRKDDHRLRPALPDSARITRMDEALGWIPQIPQDRYVLRRIVGARALVSPVTERHLFTWRRLATLLGADHKAVQRWHAQGVAMIVAALAG
jgi:Domain of unknown function (DUF6362)